jgi:hypothetical protein
MRQSSFDPMDPIVRFVVDGMDPKRADDAAELLMRMP